MNDSRSTAGYHDVITGSRHPEDLEPGAANVEASSSPELKGLLSLMVAVVVVAALYFGHEVFVPIVLAVLLSFVLAPVVTRLQRLGLWRPPAVIITMIAAFAVIGAIGTVIGTQAASLAVDAPRYAQTIQTKVTGAQGFASEKLGALSHLLSGAGSTRRPAQPSPGQGQQQTSGGQHAVPVQVVNEKSSSFTVVKSIVSPVLAPLETLALVLIVTIFILLQREDLRDRFIRLFGSRDLHRTTLAMDDAGQRLSRYFLSQLCVNAGFGVVIGIGTWLIGIPAPALWGILAGLLRFVPYIGSILAAVAPIALGAAIDPGWSMAIYVAVLFAVAEPVTGYVVEPLLYGHSTGLSPIAVIVAAIFWTWAWGPIGLILSTPLTLCLVVLGRHVKSLEFFDVMLGDRPALTADKSFYQRVIAGNPDEALAQAEQLLVDTTLASYYDNVVVPALRLAAEDVARGSIDRRRAAEIRRTVLEVVADLASNADPEGGEPVSPDNLNGLSVACAPGPGPFDPALAAMLAQLLEHAGATVLRIRQTQLSRDAITSLDLSSVAVVAVAALGAEESPPALRYLVRRLKGRSGTKPIWIGPASSDAAGRVVSSGTVSGAEVADSLSALVEKIEAISSADQRDSASTT